jgi:flagella basal body P-ring formation protein FlgA
MTSFVDLMIATTVISSGLPASLAERVARTIGERWHVPAPELRLEWGAIPAQGVRDSAAFRLAGSGADGRFVVVLAPESGPPCAIRVRAGVLDTIAVAAHAIASGTRLVAEDVVREPRLAWGPPGADAACPGAGWEARRAIGAGEPLRWPSVARPPVIASGDPVLLRWSRGDVSVTLAGVALQSAGVGERLRARIEGRSVRVEAIATGPGTASLTEEGAR